MHFFSSFSVFFNKTCCVLLCFWGLFHSTLSWTSLLFNTQHTHTPHTYIYNNEKYGIVSCEYGIVFSRLRGERREKTFASLFSLSLSIRFFFSFNAFLTTYEERRAQKICRASTREKYRERGRRWWISRRFSQEKEGECLKVMNVMLISRLRTSQRARNVAFSTMMMCFLFLSLSLKTSFFPLCCEHKGEKLFEI